jgi:hypothetical protein
MNSLHTVDEQCLFLVVPCICALFLQGTNICVVHTDDGQCLCLRKRDLAMRPNMPLHPKKRLIVLHCRYCGVDILVKNILPHVFSKNLKHALSSSLIIRKKILL